MTTNTSIQVIERAGRLLEAIAANGNAASLKVIAAETGLHPSTAFRIAGALMAIGWVERNGEHRYTLGRKLLQLSRQVRPGTDLQVEAQPVMEWLRDAVGETVNLTVRERDEVIYVGRVLSPRMMRVEQVIGSRAPLHVTAVGKLMLGDAGEAACRRYAERTGLPALTANTVTRVEALIRETSAAATAGYAYDNEEAETGVGCIGVLIRDGSGAAVAGLSISAPIERRREAWIGLLRQAGNTISGRLA